jgi:hypothetical protein
VTRHVHAYPGKIKEIWLLDNSNMSRETFIKYFKSRCEKLDHLSSGETRSGETREPKKSELLRR